VHRPFRFSSIAVVASFALLSAVAGCSAEEGTPEDTTTYPAPSEPEVFDASKETKSELGIVKWGFDSRNDGDEMIYRGYGDRNQVLTEVVRRLDRSNDDRWVLTMTASGKLGSASERVEFHMETKPSGDQEIYATVTENSFKEGEGALKVLMAFKADGTAYANADEASLTTGGSLVSGTGDQLVDRCQQLASRCNRLLIRDEIAADGQSSECGLLRTIGVPLLGGIIGAGAGALVGGVGAVPGAAVGVVSAAGTQAALCLDAQLGARRARQELQQCQQQQRQAGCAVTN
jgi:hypothetical protein